MAAAALRGWRGGGGGALAVALGLLLLAVAAAPGAGRGTPCSMRNCARCRRVTAPYGSKGWPGTTRVCFLAKKGYAPAFDRLSVPGEWRGRRGGASGS